MLEYQSTGIRVLLQLRQLATDSWRLRVATLGADAPPGCALFVDVALYGVILGASSVAQLEANLAASKAGPLTAPVVAAWEGAWEDGRMGGRACACARACARVATEAWPP